MKVKITKINSDCMIPSRQSYGSSGFDIEACVSAGVKINPGSIRVINTGFKIEIPMGYEAQIRSRSGLAYRHGIIVLNSPGTIDSDYRDEVKIILFNFGESVYIVQPRARIAQMVFAKVEIPEFIYSRDLSKTDRLGGFGSTGI